MTGDRSTSTSFSTDEIPRALYGLEQAFETIVNEKTVQSGNGSNGAEEEVVEQARCKRLPVS